MQSRIAPADMRLFTIFGHFMGGHGVLVSILIMVLGGPLRYRRPALLRMRPILVWVASEIVLQPSIRTLARRCTLNASLQFERRPLGIFSATCEVSLKNAVSLAVRRLELLLYKQRQHPWSIVSRLCCLISWSLLCLWFLRREFIENS